MKSLDDLNYSIFPKGTVIFREGDAGEDAYLIQSGSVEIVVQRGQSSRVVDTLAHGDFFGEMALIDDVPRSATAVASADAICAAFTKQQMDEKLAAADLFTLGIIRLLTKRLRKTTARLA